MANTIVITKLTNGNILINNAGAEYTLQGNNLCVNETTHVDIRSDRIQTLDKFTPEEVEKVVRADGTETFISDNATLFFELYTFFFFRLSNGSGGGASGSAGGFANFREEFQGDGIATTFQLDGSITNGSFDSGSWDVNVILLTQPKDIARKDNFKPVYDSALLFVRNRVSVVSISASGLVTLSHAPRSGVDFNIYYWYDLKTDDVIDDYQKDDVATSAEIDTQISSQVPMQTISGATYDNLQDNIQVTQSTGIVQGGIISDNGDGTVDVTAGELYIRTSNSNIAPLLSADFPAGSSIALTDNSPNFIYVEYNGGVLQYVVSTVPLVDVHTNVVVGIVQREGTTLYITQVNIPTAQVPQLVAKRFVFLEGIQNQSGGRVSEVGTRQIATTVGQWWLGLDEFSTTAKDTSAADRFIYYYGDGGSGFTAVTAQDTIDNTQYDDGSGSLATLANNRYGIHWVFTDLDSNLYVVYGLDSYTLTDAEDEGEIPLLPAFMTGFFVALLAKIVILKGDSTFTSIQIPFDTNFSGSMASNHNELGNIQGGTTDERNHLTNAELAKLGGIEALADVTDSTNVNAAGATMNTDADVSGNSYVLDEDDLSSNSPTQLPTQQSVKAYVDGVVAGASPKESCRAATTTHLDAVTGNTWTKSGSGAGKTMTDGAVGIMTVDGTALLLGNRVMIKDEDGSSTNLTNVDNGIYEVTTEGTAGVATVLTRATDFDGDPSGEVKGGSYSFITTGTENDKTGWMVSNGGTIDVDTDPLLFVQFQGLPANHGSTHTDGTDDIQNATASQKGLATATQITKLDAIEALAEVNDRNRIAFGLETPSASENAGGVFTDKAITITKAAAVLVNGTSVDWTIRHDTDRSATGNELITGGKTTTSETTGDVITSFDDATIPANSWIWLETTDKTGVIDWLNITLIFTED